MFSLSELVIDVQALAKGLEQLPQQRAEDASRHLEAEDRNPLLRTADQEILKKWSSSEEQQRVSAIAADVRRVAQEAGEKVSALQLCKKLQANRSELMTRSDAYLIGEVIAKQHVAPGEPNAAGGDGSVMSQRAGVIKQVLDIIAVDEDEEPER